MTTPPDHRDELLRALAAENREFRELLTAVAQELERMAAAGETDARPLLAQAMRIRRLRPDTSEPSGGTRLGLRSSAQPLRRCPRGGC
jgi:hypothetical protein